ncbi:MAG: flagellar biosynthesis repressor FlbT [Alphaproteobacteria bacterium]|nr:flagellar biosynthesis repressor FlbT [Alphaproteobacteria bacterium]
MPLKIRVKPEDKILAGGAVLKNVGKHPADLLVLSDGPVLRERYMMNRNRQGDSDMSNVYFLLQVIYLFKGKDKPMDNLVLETIRNFAKLYPVYESETKTIIELLEKKETFKALRVARSMLSENGESPIDPAEARSV